MDVTFGGTLCIPQCPVRRKCLNLLVIMIVVIVIFVGEGVMGINYKHVVDHIFFLILRTPQFVL